MRSLVALLFLTSLLAGCQSPEGPPPDDEPLRRLRVEAERAAGGTCPEGMVYEAWASEGLVVRMEPGCGLRFDLDLLRPARPEAVQARGEGVLVFEADGAPWSRISVGADGPHLLPWQGAELAPGPHEVVVRLEGKGLWFDHFDLRETEPALPADATQAPASPGAAATAEPVGLSGPHRFEAEHRDHTDRSCGPEGQEASTEAKDWASNGEVVRLPGSGCGLVFEDVDFATSSHFVRFRTTMETGGEDVEVVVRVLVAGEPVASATVDNRVGDAPFTGSFKGPRAIPAGEVDVRVEFEVLRGPRTMHLLLDHVESDQVR